MSSIRSSLVSKTVIGVFYRWPFFYMTGDREVRV
jgi:hypothetical protein